MNISTYPNPYVTYVKATKEKLTQAFVPHEQEGKECHFLSAGDLPFTFFARHRRSPNFTVHKLIPTDEDCQFDIDDYIQGEKMTYIENVIFLSDILSTSLELKGCPDRIIEHPIHIEDNLVDAVFDETVLANAFPDAKYIVSRDENGELVGYWLYVTTEKRSYGLFLTTLEVENCFCKIHLHNLDDAEFAECESEVIAHISDLRLAIEYFLGIFDCISNKN